MPEQFANTTLQFFDVPGGLYGTTSTFRVNYLSLHNIVKIDGGGGKSVCGNSAVKIDGMGVLSVQCKDMEIPKNFDVVPDGPFRPSLVMKNFNMNPIT